MTTSRIFACAIMVIAVGCSYTGGVENPVDRKFGWFDFLDGGDLKRACTAGAPETLRLVYNQDWRTQVRIYELTTPNAQPVLQRVVVGPRRPGLRIGENYGLDWSETPAVKALDRAELARLDASLIADGMFGPAPDFERVHAFESFWTVSGCHAGTPVFNVVRFADPRWARLEFPKVLRALEPPGGDAWAEPRLASASEALLGDSAGRNAVVDEVPWRLITSRTGFRNLGRIF